MKNHKFGQIKLIDRFALAFLSGFTSFLTAAICWAIISMVAILGFDKAAVSFAPVYLFAAVMAILGFLNGTNIVLNILFKIWQVLLKAVQGYNG